MEKEKKKNKVLIAFLVLFVICVVGIVGFYFIRGNKEESSSSSSNSNQQEESKVVQEEVVKELKEMIGYDDEFQLLHREFIGENGVIDQLDAYTKLFILDYATMNSRKSLPLDYDEICLDMDECIGIPITTIEATAKKYGITNPTKLFDDEQSYVKSGDYYICLGSGYGMATSIESSNFKASYQGEDILVEEDIEETYLEETEEQKKYHMSYTFQKDAEKNYYLYSVTSKDA